MKKLLLVFVAGAALGAAGSWLVLHRTAPGEIQAEGEGEKNEPDKLLAGVRLTKEQQTEAGITLAKPEPEEMKPRVRAYGRVLDPSGLATGLAEIEAAQAVAEASAKEFTRLKSLGDNAAARALESAEAAMKRDRVAVELARARLLASWGAQLEQRPDLPGLTRSLLTQSAALIRIDVPAGEALSSDPLGIEIAAVAGGSSYRETELIGPAPNADPQSLGRGFLVLARGEGLAPGMALTATLTVPGPPREGFQIPRGAVIQDGSELFVFVHTGAEVFARKRVEVGAGEGESAFVISGLSGDDEVVVRGAQQLLSEERKGMSGE